MEALNKHVLENNLVVLSTNVGHRKNMGRYSGKVFNPYFLVRNENEESVEKEYYIMFCNPNMITYFSIEDYNKVICQDYTWSYNPLIGYVFTADLYLHQLVMDHSGFGKGQLSVDHINQNKIDNRRCNLRITTQSEQNTNRGKVSRHFDAKKIPEEFMKWLKNERQLDNLPKFCEYYKNDKEKKEFFVINHFHPLVKEKNERVKISSKCGTCGNYSLIDKYKQIEKGFLFLEEKKNHPIDSWTYTELKNKMLE